MTKIKICGITKLEDALACIDYGADAIGFVFAESPRRIDRSRCKEIVDRLPPFITTVGLFANQPQKEVDETVKYLHLDILQFHGDESPEFCSNFNKRIIKAFRISDKNDLKKLDNYKVSAYLLDSYDSKKLGGTGKTFDWGLIKGIKNKRIILAGGLTPDNVGEAIRECLPYGVDVSSGVEKSPGIKDHKKIKKFIEAVKRNDITG
ncbi:MAG: phosphoribosylanthranilate isomerase [bacterium]|nr:phosphoribosylanthranilate isomerase [bacterium]